MPLPVSSSTLGEELMGQEHDTFAWPAPPLPVHIHKLSEPQLLTFDPTSK